jgi:phage gpG-like protein
MALLDFSGLEEVENAILKEPELLKEVVPKMLKAGAAVIIQAQKAEASRMGLERSGSLIGSIGIYEEVYDDLRPRIIVYPTDTNTKGVRNAAIGSILNYGVKLNEKIRIEARPFMKVANAASEGAAQEVMKRIWEAIK